MSLPPETITVKRKRRVEGDDEPVKFLRVEEPKRQASGTWLYRRKQPDITGADQPSSPNRPQDARPSIRSSRPGDENRLLRAQVNESPNNLYRQTGQNIVAPPVALPGSAPLPSNSNAEPRRFHLSRFDMEDQPSEPAGPGSSKRSRFASALFVERSTKRKRATPPAENDPAAQLTEPEDMAMEDEAPRTLKRPGVGSRTKGRRTPPQVPEKKKPELPPSLRNRQEGNTAALAREMDDYILQQIGHDLAKLEAEPKPKTTPIKYRPRAPVKRYAERHPGIQDKREEDVAMDETDTEDEDYVLETYERVPAHTLTVPVPTEQVGLLVFDEETDIEYFYGAGDDSSDEYLDEDEDSNAEDYYAADYPEDEVESDDEYGRDDYHYRTTNASDMEEFDGVGGEDEDDIARSDGEASGPLPGASELWRLERMMRSKLGLSSKSDGSPMAMD